VPGTERRGTSPPLEFNATVDQYLVALMFSGNLPLNLFAPTESGEETRAK
jgi:hypothetical protein